MSICDECQLIETICRGTDGLEKCDLFVKKPKSESYRTNEKDSCQKFADIVCKIFDETKALYKEKAEQYAQGDPLANFRGGAALQGMNPESLDDCFRVLLGYCDKHIAFVHQSGKLGKKEAESLKDIANYMVIALGMYRMKGENEDET